MGQVIARSGENWRVDIGAAHAANLDGLAFEGATKRNRPNLKVRACAFSCTYFLTHNARSRGAGAGRLIGIRTSVAGT